MDFYQFLIPRLEGDKIEKDFYFYERLARKGVAGFIVFGGEIETLREGIARLQKASPLPLIIASDLEQGLGQQVRGGTLFPPAMALAEAAKDDRESLRAVFTQMAEEAAYAGINTILAPVLDINTNPENPIIGTRAFGEDPHTVSVLGVEMITTLQAQGVMACGKHFPGHGNTSIDSHISLPVVQESLKALESSAMMPFRAALQAGVRMIMPGHLSVPSIDASGTPMTISAPAVRYLRKTLGFQGIIITDAMNMGGLGSYSEPEASTTALKVGVDILLHPEEPDKLASDLNDSGISPSTQRLSDFRKSLLPAPSKKKPSFDASLAQRLAEKAVRVEGPLVEVKTPFVIILSDEGNDPGGEFINSLKAKHLVISRGSALNGKSVPPGSDIIVAIFSSVKAWKGGTASWIKETIPMLANAGARVFVSFGNPYVLREAGLNKTRVCAYWASNVAQRAAAGKILMPGS